MNPLLPFADDLNACVILAKFLPKPKRAYPYEANMNPDADLTDFFHVVPVSILFLCTVSFYEFRLFISCPVFFACFLLKKLNP